ncbi:Cytochrome P450 4d2 [Orchesella cincta]|uniref:Cytochrome P450 4d2 n=1 Tax=Orchesella cincta TaxID=48709 RepID=A0A1D2MY73_ORCCI|nr:Cytochrome P450 4d2 [Orchesella cincta]
MHVVDFTLQTLFLKRKSKYGGERDSDKYKGFHSLPGPRPFPIRFIGNALQLPKRRDMHRMMDEMYAKYGQCYRLTLLNEEIVCLNTAPLAQAILGSNDLNHFRKGEQYDIYFSGTEGLPMLTGEKWKTRRKMISGSFKYKAFQRYNPSFNKHTEKLLEQLDKLYQDGKAHLINDLVKDCVFKQSSEAIMGIDISGNEGGAVFAKSLETYAQTVFKMYCCQYLNIIAERLCKPWLLLNWVWRFHPLSFKQKRVFDKMINVTKTVKINSKIHLFRNKTDNFQLYK